MQNQTYKIEPHGSVRDFGRAQASDAGPDHGRIPRVGSSLSPGPGLQKQGNGKFFLSYNSLKPINN